MKKHKTYVCPQQLAKQLTTCTRQVLLHVLHRRAGEGSGVGGGGWCPMGQGLHELPAPRRRSTDGDWWLINKWLTVH